MGDAALYRVDAAPASLGVAKPSLTRVPRTLLTTPPRSLPTPSPDAPHMLSTSRLALGTPEHAEAPKELEP